DPQHQLAALGRAYIDFGLANPALFELMFQANQLNSGDSGLIQAQRRAIGTLYAAVSRETPLDATPSGAPILALISWAFVHGLVVLARDGALPAAAGTEDVGVTELAHELTDRFTEYVGQHLATFSQR
ncbi:TetR-like C-terminal domain-containing protein, partial [Mycobacterium sp.]|uniref:TetR-like C-terminal domain-containing protein n=1 Tax=Mycobacterium sp. TaxID=1785 RepID=UPI0012806628